MAALKHPLVEDRIIEGQGTSREQWLHAFEHGTHRHRRRITQGADGAALDVVRHRVEQRQVVGAALAVFDAVNDAPQPARAFAAGSALAAGLVLVEVGQAQQALDHVARVVHHDHGARAQHGAGLGDGVVVHRAFHDDVGRQHGRGRSAGDHGLELAARAHAARQLQQLAERRAQRHFVVAGQVDVAADREDLGAAIVGLAALQVRSTAVADDPGNGRKGFGVVDGGGLAVQAEAGRERRLEARLALLAFQRLQQRSLFAADVGAEAMVRVQLEAEAAAHDVVTQVAGSAGLFQRGLEALIGLEDFAVDVVVAQGDAHRVGRDDHALDHDVGVVHQDVPVLAGARLAFVRVAHQMLLARELAGHEAPLQARGETCAAAAAQPRLLDGGDHLILRQAFAAVLAQDLAQRLVAAACLVVLDGPVGAGQIGIDLGIDVAVVEAGLAARGGKPGQDRLCGGVHALPSAARRPSISSSSFSLLMKLHMQRSFTSITGESAQAPRHSDCCSVNMPSGVVSPILMPRRDSRWCSAL